MYKTTQYLFVTNLGTKEIVIGYLYLYKHNPNINWQKDQWEFTRCPDTCASKAYKTQNIEVGANKFHLKMFVSEFLLLDKIGDEDPNSNIFS